jgi:hypothetical protein
VCQCECVCFGWVGMFSCMIWTLVPFSSPFNIMIRSSQTYSRKKASLIISGKLQGCLLISIGVL